MVVSTDLSKYGDVSLPIGELRYDLIFDDHGDMYRVQVKTANIKGQNNDAYTAHVMRGRNTEKYKYHDFDILAIVPNDGDSVAYWPWCEKTTRSTISIWFGREPRDFRPCNRESANISSELTIFEAIDRLK